MKLYDSGELRDLFGGRSDVWLWRRIKDQTLPRPIMISGRRYWRRDEIDAIIDGLTAVRDEAA